MWAACLRKVVSFVLLIFGQPLPLLLAQAAFRLSGVLSYMRHFVRVRFMH